MTSCASLQDCVEQRVRAILATAIDVPPVTERLSAAEIAAVIDHTVLKADATEAQVVKLCQEAQEYGFAAVCVNASYVALCHELLNGTEVGGGQFLSEEIVQFLFNPIIIGNRVQSQYIRLSLL